ncbi:MAG TPA: HEAT repeat domain-containing protein [Kofleriaceae bacterium]|nr:HEAT repeat domain-containing protein [Kofleriaceae bacterium]
MTGRRLVVWIAVVVALGRAAPARADRIAELDHQLASSSEKTRLAAVVALARIGDKRALKPLVAALRDPSAEVRAIAATALGHLGHKAALPSLRNLASDDTDETVRDKARQAAIAVARANDLPDSLPAPVAAEPAPAARPGHHASGFGHSPHAVDDRPDLYVLVKSSSDESPGRADQITRKANAEVVKQALLDSLRDAPQVTTTEAEAQRWGLDPRHIDLSVVRMDVVQSGANVEVHAELRLAISDDSGKMLSFLSGGAKIEVPRAKFDPRYLTQMRKDALEGALRGLFDKLLAHLRRTSQS